MNKYHTSKGGWVVIGVVVALLALFIYGAHKDHSYDNYAPDPSTTCLDTGKC